MATNDIKQNLINTFNKPLDEFYKRRIVFWNDYDNEFESFVDELELDNVIIIKLNGKNNFSTKKLILNDEPLTNFLIYNPNRYKKEEDNWLLDIELYSDTFKADYLSFLIDELNIPDSINIRNTLKEYSKFFDNNKRLEKLKGLNVNIEDNKSLNFSIIAVLSNSKSIELSEILLNILKAGFENNKIINDIEKYGNIEILNKIINKYVGYNGNNLEDLLKSILLSSLCQNIDGDLLKKYYPKYVNEANSLSCYNIINDWLNSKDSDSAIDLLTNIGNELDINDFIEKNDISSISNCDIIPQFNEVLLKKVFTEINNNVIKVNENIKLVNKRRMMKYYDEYKNYFEGIYYASKLQEMYIKYQNVFHMITSKEVWNQYEENLYLIDTYYRKFHHYFNLSLIHTNIFVDDEFKKCADYVENLYKNWFLKSLCKNWMQASNEEYTNKGMAYGIDHQLDFYSNYVMNRCDDKITFVIISDALRYEVAKELSDNLAHNDRAKVSIKSMQGIFPSVTEYGMSALLPGKKRIDNNLDIYVSDIKAEGVVNRELILKKELEQSIAIKYEDFLKLKKDERNELIKGMKVVYIYHDEIDARGHINEKQVFDACEDTITKLVNLVSIIVSLRSSSYILITSDHGFLYNYKPLDEFDKASKGDIPGVLSSSRRYIVGDNNLSSDYMLKLKLLINNEKNDYYGLAPYDVVRIKKPGAGENYVHGGLSLEEIVIPVILYENVRSDSKEYQLNSDKYDTNYAKLQLLNEKHKISNLSFSLNFFQTEAISNKILEATYEIYMVDNSGQIISDIKTIIANKNNQDSSERTFKTILNLKNQEYKNNELYYLMIMNKNEQKLLERIEYQINIIFNGDFDF